MKKDTEPEFLLENLKQSLTRLKTLLAWQQLKESEQNPNQPPAFMMYDPTKIDLRNEYSRFESINVQLQEVFTSSKVPTIIIVRTRREYLRIKQELNILKIPEKLKGLS